jgi:hypothetical protein
MAADKSCFIRLACNLAGIENYDEKIGRDRDFTYSLTRSPTMLREYHAALGIAHRLELLVQDATPPMMIDVHDLCDGALKAPFEMSKSDEIRLIKFMREHLGKSPIAKIEVTAGRELVLWAFAYDEQTKRSQLKPVDSSRTFGARKAG